MMKEFFAVGMLALAFASFGCAEEGDEVLLNGRLFNAQTMESHGGGCSLYRLGSKAKSQLAGGAVDSDVRWVEEQTETSINVSVTEGGTIVASRAYDAAFFQSGRLDEFTAPVQSGPGLLLRYWGKYHPASSNDCTPLDQDGPL
jgi:hypothetical protein